MTAYVDAAARIADLEAKLAAAEIRAAHLDQVLGDLTHQLAERTRQATRDPLTGLLNRRGLGEAWDDRPAGLHVALIDLDHFKRINDTHGHATGDRLLTAVAALIQPYGLAVRLGGDELLLAAPPAVLDQWRASWWVDLGEAGRVTVTGTTGIATAVDDLDETLRRADVAMYAAKRAGRGGRRVWTPELDEATPTADVPARRRVRDAEADTAGWPGDRPGDPSPMPWPVPPAPCPRDKPITVRVKRCCRAVLVRERCDCRAVRRQIRRAPVLYVTARRAAA